MGKEGCPVRGSFGKISYSLYDNFVGKGHVAEVDGMAEMPYSGDALRWPTYVLFGWVFLEDRFPQVD